MFTFFLIPGSPAPAPPSPHNPTFLNSLSNQNLRATGILTVTFVKQTHFSANTTQILLWGVSKETTEPYPWTGNEQRLLLP